MLLRVWLTDIANCLPPLGSESTHAPMRGNGTRSYSHVEARQFRFQVFSHKSYALRWDHGPATDGGRGDQPGGGVVIADPSRRSSKAARRPAQHQLDRQNRAAQPQSPQPPNLPHHLPSIDSQSWPDQGSSNTRKTERQSRRAKNSRLMPNIVNASVTDLVDPMLRARGEPAVLSKARSYFYDGSPNRCNTTQIAKNTIDNSPPITLNGYCLTRTFLSSQGPKN